METKYEQIKFDSWQELAKFVIDGGEVYIKKQPTLKELIAIKPRLCWVWDCTDDPKIIREIDCFYNDLYYSGGLSRGMWWQHAQMLTDDEIKQFLGGE